jgi:hypothetical protein
MGNLILLFGAGIVGGGQFVSSKIEGGLEIVDDIPTNNRKPVLDFLYSGKPQEIFSAFRVTLTGDRIRSQVASEYFGGVFIELKHVLSGPFDL